MRIPVLAFFLLVLQTIALRANMADPNTHAYPVSEPFGSLDSIVIEHEDLLIDMRGLTDPKAFTKVTARYHVLNNSSDRMLRLTFITGGFHTSHSVTLDGQSIQSNPEVLTRVPSHWRLPDSIPIPGEDGYARYLADFPIREEGRDVNMGFPQDQKTLRISRVDTVFSNGLQFYDVRSIQFDLVIPSGRHEILVSYDAITAIDGYQGPVNLYQFGYVLSPARDWGGFGSLTTEVLVPEGWEAATEPLMNRVGDRLEMTWEGIPSDHLAVSTRLAIPSGVIGQILVDKLVSLSFIITLIGTFICSWYFGIQGFQSRFPKRGRIIGLISAVLLPVLSYVIPFLAIEIETTMSQRLLGDQEVISARYMITLVPFMASFLAPIVGFAAYGLGKAVRSSRNELKPDWKKIEVQKETG